LTGILQGMQHLSDQELLHMSVWNIDRNIIENTTSIKLRTVILHSQY